MWSVSCLSRRAASRSDEIGALFDILDELDGGLVAVFDVVARVAVIAVAGQQALVGGIQAQLWHVLVIHDDQPLVAMLHERDIGLNQSGWNFVVAQAGPGIECADVVERRLHRFHGTPDGAPNFLELL